MPVRGRNSPARLLVVVLLATVATVSVAWDVHAAAPTPTAAAPVTSPTPTPVATAALTPPPPPTPTPAPTPAPRGYSALEAAVEAAISAGGTSDVGVSLVELGGVQPGSWSLEGETVFVAASTYKLAALMREAQRIAEGQVSPDGLICYTDADYEDGWYDDYVDGSCFTRQEIASRAAQQSDNTAGHMLVRDVGGSDVLNAWAASLGATHSDFFDSNTTTAGDLAALWVAEASGKLGGAAAQTWLYPLLTHTAYEGGIPAGVPAEATVVHKTGALDSTENDAALVLGGAHGAYVLTVTSDGLDAAGGTALLASISAIVWRFEAAR